MALRTIFSKITVLFLMTVSCESQEPSSELNHDVGRVMNDEGTFSWADLSFEQHLWANNLHMGPNGEKLLPLDHPFVVHMQQWTEHVRETMLTLDGRISGTPLPHILALTNSRVNAFVSNSYSCLDIGLKVEDDSLNNAELLTSVYFRRDPGQWERTSTQSRCIPTKLSLEKQKEALISILSPFADCAVRWQETTAVVPAACGKRFNDKTAPFTGAKQLVIAQTDNWLTLYTGLTTLTEPMAVGILFHELGHYYLAHGTTSANQYGYFYQMSEQNEDGRPAADPALNSLAHEVMAAQKNHMSLAKIDGQRFHSLIFSAMVHYGDVLLKAPCADGSQLCKEQCAPIQAFLVSPEAVSWRGFPYERLPVGALSQYFDYESKLSRCLVALRFQKKEIDSLTWAFGEFSFDPAPLYEATNGEQTVLLAGAKLDGLINERNRKGDTAVDEANRERLGYYTTEQEADEFALEMMIRVGLDPESYINAMLELAKMRDDSSALAVYGEYSWAECARAMESADSSSVPIGDYRDIHHSPCFRAYNLKKELLAHKEKYDAIRLQGKVPSSDYRFSMSWGDIVSLVRRDAPP